MTEMKETDVSGSDGHMAPLSVTELFMVCLHGEGIEVVALNI